MQHSATPPLPPLSPLITRRRALTLLGAGAGAALLSPRSLFAVPAPPPLASPGPPRQATVDPHHIAWVWQFRHDGDPFEVRDALAAHGLGIALKTHDGPRWMSRFDPTEYAVGGPERVAEYVRFFEDGGVPFHAWAVVRGTEPEHEAEIASEVLAAGVRSLFVDLEAHSGFWVGTDDDAERYGETLRRLQPSARLSTSIDPRPWEIDRIPLAQFASFVDEIAPQVYWQVFTSRDNVRRYQESSDLIGVDTVTAESVTPAFVLAAAMPRLQQFGLPIHPLGDGESTSPEAWLDFIAESYAAGASSVSLWRYGIADPAVLQVLAENPPRVQVHVVQPGDTLSGIAAQYGTTVAAIVEANELANPDLISVGQELRIPGGIAPPATPLAAAVAAGGTHVVQPGETLSAIAVRYGTTVDAIASLNGITDVHFVREGQELRIP